MSIRELKSVKSVPVAQTLPRGNIWSSSENMNETPEQTHHHLLALLDRWKQFRQLLKHSEGEDLKFAQINIFCNL